MRTAREQLQIKCSTYFPSYPAVEYFDRLNTYNLSHAKMNVLIAANVLAKWQPTNESKGSGASSAQT